MQPMNKKDQAGGMRDKMRYSNGGVSMNGFKPAQMITINTHRAAGRRVHAVRHTTILDVAAIAVAAIMAVCGSMLAWHIFTVAKGI